MSLYLEQRASSALFSAQRHRLEPRPIHYFLSLPCTELFRPLILSISSPHRRSIAKKDEHNKQKLATIKKIHKKHAIELVQENIVANSVNKNQKVSQ